MSLCGPGIETLPSNAGSAGLIPGPGAKIPCATWPQNQIRSNIVINSMKTLKQKIYLKNNKLVQDFPQLQSVQQASKKIIGLQIAWDKIASSMGTCLFLKTLQSFCIRCFLKIQNSDQPGSWRANIWLGTVSLSIEMENGRWIHALSASQRSVCVCVCVCVCACVSVVGQKHYLQKCSLEYRELDFFPLLAVVQKYNGHPIRKSLFLSPINLGKRHFISNFFLMT